MCKFSILLVTYQPQIEKVLFTLNSVLEQSFNDYEIVISDDGSKENFFKEIEAYFYKKNFKKYVLLPHEENVGTVKNLIRGLEKCSGKYVRDFGPGDAFYSMDTLERVYNFLEDNQYESCFGLMRGYSRKENGELDFYTFPHPFDIEAYQTGKNARVKKNLVLYRDNASGAVTCYKKDFYLEYLKKIEGTVRYVEDIFQILAAVEGHQMQYFDDYIVWYEMKSGVSTQKNSKFQEALNQDVESFFEMLYEKYPNDPDVKRQHSLLSFYKIKNVYLRNFCRFFKNPDMLSYLIRHYIQKRNGIYEKKGLSNLFIEKIISED